MAPGHLRLRRSRSTWPGGRDRQEQAEDLGIVRGAVGRRRGKPYRAPPSSPFYQTQTRRGPCSTGAHWPSVLDSGQGSVGEGVHVCQAPAHPPDEASGPEDADIRVTGQETAAFERQGPAAALPNRRYHDRQTLRIDDLPVRGQQPSIRIGDHAKRPLYREPERRLRSRHRRSQMWFRLDDRLRRGDSVDQRDLAHPEDDEAGA